MAQTLGYLRRATARAWASRASIPPCSAPSTACRASSKRPSPLRMPAQGRASRRAQFRPSLRPPPSRVGFRPQHRHEMRGACALSDLLPVFGYAHIPSFKKHQCKIAEDTLPDSINGHLQSDTIVEVLVDAGYVRIGFDHFALPDDNPAVAKAGRQAASEFPGLYGRLRRHAHRARRQLHRSHAAGFRARSCRLPHPPMTSAAIWPRTGSPLPRVTQFQLDPYRLRADIIERIMCDMAVEPYADRTNSRPCSGVRVSSIGRG